MLQSAAAFDKHIVILLKTQMKLPKSDLYWLKCDNHNGVKLSSENT